MKGLRGIDRRAWSWALYDWANSAFATTVMAGFFPVFFKQYWSEGVNPTVSTLRLGIANSAASVVMALLAPALGALADRGGSRKRFLLFFTALGVSSTALLPLVDAGLWQAAAALYLLASLGFAGGMIFYDALLVGAAEKKRFDFVSALGYSLGYLGGGVLFALNIAMVTRPDLFGLSGASAAVQASFVTVALWWAVFSVPLFLLLPEPPATAAAPGKGALTDLADTLRHLTRHREAFLFLIAYWLYIDGVDTVIRMAVDYGLSIGFPAQSLMTALLITQFVGFPAAILFGKFGERVGPKRGIYAGLLVYVGVVVWGYFMDSAADFYLLAVTVGLVQGGVQALSRSYYARLIPADRSAQFFGFYNMLGKFAAVAGPLLVGWTGVVTGSPRAGILSILVLFAGGAAVLHFVPSPAPVVPSGGARV